MSTAEKAHALLEAVTSEQIAEMSPLQRRRFAHVCRRVADLADPPALPAPPRSGVLFDLHRGERAL